MHQSQRQSLKGGDAAATLSLKEGINGGDLLAALTDTGFAILTDHGVDLSRLHEAYRSVEAFFALPQTEKNRFITPHAGQRGYTPFGTENAKDNPVPDLKEFWHVGRDKILPNIWPNHPEDFRRNIAWLYDAIDALGLTLLKSLTGPLGIAPSTFDDLAGNGNSVLRLLHYPPIPADAEPKAVRAAAHEDINLITLLVAASADGLELLDRQGLWQPIRAPADAIVVDAGDMLARITAGAIPATTHRVVNPSGPNVSRYSMPFFLHPRPDALLSVLPPFDHEGSPPTIRADAFLSERLRAIGLKA
ncbi:MAG: 2-oxoglutarate and iron-dependent oxygenase domain-containing protein [Pseudomonadota bacterium]